MRRQILERRLDCLNYSLSGVRASTWVPTVAAKYECTESCVWSDWSRRSVWLPKLLQLNEAAYKVSELLAGLERAREVAYGLMQMGASQSVRIGATRALGSLSKVMFEIGTESGTYPSLLKDVLDKLVKLEEELPPS